MSGEGDPVVSMSVIAVLQEESGHIVLLGLFDCVDDTVLVKKVVLSVSAPVSLPLIIL